LLIRTLLDPVCGDHLPFITFYLVLPITGWYGGFGPTVMALVLGLLTASHFFMTPRYDLALSLPDHLLKETAFIFLGLTIAVFSEALRASRRRADAHAREAIQQRLDLEREMVQTKRLEHQLQQRAEQLVEADRRKNQFLAVLGHELRNPLASLRGAAQVLTLEGAPQQQVQWALSVLGRQITQLTRLVDDLLDISRISNGILNLQKRWVELAEIVEQAVEMARPLITARRHELIEALPSSPVWLEGDPARLAQALANLLTNAAKYTDERGRITLAADKQPTEVVLRVRDTGIGIAPGTLRYVFDLFTQGNGAVQRSQDGLGIGLSLAKQLIAMHGGSIQAFSEGHGKGSEFVVRLPAGERPIGTSPGVAADQAEQALFQACRVLVVDDNRDAADVLAALLKAVGHDVQTAYGGLAALEVVEHFGPEIILLDIGLPGLDGYAVARHLRKNTGSRRAYVIAVTGYGQAEDRQRALAAGFDAHLTKPVDLEALGQMIAQFVLAPKP
jgi:signal transduction histidine kinase